MSAVEAKIDGYRDQHQSLARRLRELIFEESPNVIEAVKWNKPTFIVDEANLFYLADSKDHIKFGLFQGKGLPDPKGIVEGTGKNMRHVKLKADEELDEVAIRGLIQAAL